MSDVSGPSNMDMDFTLEERVDQDSNVTNDEQIPDNVELFYFVKHDNIFWPAVGVTSNAGPKKIMKLKLSAFNVTK